MDTLGPCLGGYNSETSGSSADTAPLQSEMADLKSQRVGEKRELEALLGVCGNGFPQVEVRESRLTSGLAPASNWQRTPALQSEIGDLRFQMQLVQMPQMRYEKQAQPWTIVNLVLTETGTPAPLSTRSLRAQERRIASHRGLFRRRGADRPRGGIALPARVCL